MIRTALLFLLALSAPIAIAGGDNNAAALPAAGIVVSGAWVRAVPPVSKNSAGYLVIDNRSERDDALIGARVANARVTELHEMVRDGDSMTMRRHDEIAVPAGGKATLAPGGLHLMLIDLQRPLQVGEKLDGVLLFRHAGEMKVVLEVRAQ